MVSGWRRRAAALCSLFFINSAWGYSDGTVRAGLRIFEQGVTGRKKDSIFFCCLLLPLPSTGFEFLVHF